MEYAEFVSISQRLNNELQELYSSVYAVVNIDDEYSIAVYFSDKDKNMHSDLIRNFQPCNDVYTGLPPKVILAYSKVALLVKDWVEGRTEELDLDISRILDDKPLTW